MYQLNQTDSTIRAEVTRTHFGELPDGAPLEQLTLRNARGSEVRFLPLGGIILSVCVADRDGTLDDVALGLPALDDYVDDERFFGALIGRYANRIAHARFSLDGQAHAVTPGDGGHHLHGGRRGFHKAVWEVQPFTHDGAAGAVLRHTSPAGDEGFPGTLRTSVTYTLGADDALSFDYRAVVDRATPVSLTQHLYFNLAGHDAGDVLEHELTLAASRYTPVDESLIPTGELRPVRGTAFDFTAPRAIGARIGTKDEQLRLAGGFDHNFVLDGRRMPAAPGFAARVVEPTRGRVLEVHTSEPGLQLYTGNALGGVQGKHGARYVPHGGLALETQRFPDSPNHSHFPSAVLRPGEEFVSRTIYRFSTLERPS